MKVNRQVNCDPERTRIPFVTYHTKIARHEKFLHLRRVKRLSWRPLPGKSGFGISRKVRENSPFTALVVVASQSIAVLLAPEMSTPAPAMTAKLPNVTSACMHARMCVIDASAVDHQVTIANKRGSPKCRQRAHLPTAAKAM